MIQFADNPETKDDGMPRTIQAWSPTLLQVYDECPYRAFLAKVKKIAEPERPPLPGGQEYPNDRGSRIHDEAEQYVRGHRGLPKECRLFKDNFEALHDWYAERPSDFEMEQLWCFDWDWTPVGRNAWDKHWARIKIDVFAFLHATHALVIDLKTGKREGNEIKHNEQILAYAITSFLKYEALEEITVELWYLDQDELIAQTYTREQAMRFLPRLERRAVNCTTDTEFPARPSKYTCRFCPYKTGKVNKNVEGTGHCDKNPK